MTANGFTVLAQCKKILCYCPHPRDAFHGISGLSRFMVQSFDTLFGYGSGEANFTLTVPSPEGNFGAMIGVVFLLFLLMRVQTPILAERSTLTVIYAGFHFFLKIYFIFIIFFVLMTNLIIDIFILFGEIFLFFFFK
jgi:hypothetical protein